MKIVFLCGSLEVGKDGVGDYTQRLAGELIQQGHQCNIIALMDKYISKKVVEEKETEHAFISVIRLPFKNGYKLNCKEAGKWVNVYNPDWISLQYVPFAFHSKGLPFGMGQSLYNLGKGRRWHIMVHELWVGMDKESPLKFIYWGWLQRQLIKSLYTKLKPAVIHTQCNLYIKMLEKIGFKPYHLPLFGNIPVTSNADKNNIKVETLNTNKTISFVVFGGIHHGAPIAGFAREVNLYTINSGVKVVLKMIGRCGPEQAYWEKIWKEAGLSVELLGEQSPEFISELLSNSSFGISTTPVSLIEKSGTVAAMREHGLPVLCIARSWHPRGFAELELPNGIVEFKQGGIRDFVESNTKKKMLNNISDITCQFVNNLQLAF